MLKDSFYSVIDFQKQEGSIQATILLNPDHRIYDGHFPGNPVTPGVCQIQIIKEVISDLIGQPLYLVEAKTIKFLKVLTPHFKNIDLKLDYAVTDNGIKVTATLYQESSVFLKFSGQFQKKLPQF